MNQINFLKTYAHFKSIFLVDFVLTYFVFCVRLCFFYHSIFCHDQIMTQVFIADRQKRLYWQLNTKQAFSMFSKVENTNGNEFEILPSHFNKTWRWHVGQMKNLELWRHLHICAQSLVVFLWANEYITCPKNLFFWGTLYYLYCFNTAYL